MTSWDSSSTSSRRSACSVPNIPCSLSVRSDTVVLRCVTRTAGIRPVRLPMICGTQRPGACSMHWVLVWNSRTLVRWRTRAGSSVSFSCSLRAWRCKNWACLGDTEQPSGGTCYYFWSKTAPQESSHLEGSHKPTAQFWVRALFCKHFSFLYSKCGTWIIISQSGKTKATFLTVRRKIFLESPDKFEWNSQISYSTTDSTLNSKWPPQLISNKLQVVSHFRGIQLKSNVVVAEGC